MTAQNKIKNKLKNVKKDRGKVKTIEGSELEKLHAKGNIPT